MRNFILRRLIYAIPTLIGISIITFVIVRMSPGDPIRLFTFGQRDITGEDIERLRHAYGLDKPMPLQYVDWLIAVLQLNFGQSFIYHQDAFQLLLTRVPATLQLAVVALALQLLIGVPLGVIAALKRGTWLDGVIRVFGVAGHALPAFWLGLVLIIVFAVGLRWLPSQGMLSVGKDVWDLPDRLRHILLPAFVLSLTGIANYSRILRTETLDVLGQDFIRTARAKGLSRRRALFKHGLRTALIPMATLFAYSVAGLLTGSVFVEKIFGWHGMGEWALQGYATQDVNIVAIITLFSGVLILAAGLLSDVIYAALDPRVRVS